MKRADQLIIFFRLNWVKLLILSLLVAFAALIIWFLYYGVGSFMTMEPFGKRQLMAMMGIYFIMFLIVGVVQSFIFGFVNMYFVMGGGFERLSQKRISTAKVNIKWTDVIGMEGAKREAWEIVKLLKDRRLVQAIGGKIIKGTMMVGPPGCGKTYLAKAIATETDLPFLPTVGSEFVGIFVGTGTQRMKSLFQEARALANVYGGCIIFIDEIDSFARPRYGMQDMGASTSHNATINQFLTELDGLRQHENNIAVLAATNVDESELDPAIMRAGRFDRKIHVTLPNLKEREELFQFYLKKIAHDDLVRPDILAKKALWFSPSDIENLVREASIISLREKVRKVSMKDLSEAYDRVIFGLRSNITLTDKEKHWTAYHEAGHAVIAYLLHPTDDVIKATIIPHKGMLGFVSHRSAEELHTHTKEKFLADIKVSIASYVAEKLKFGTTSSGVGGGRNSDFDHAMRIAHAMVYSLGMGKSGLIGDFNAMATPYGQTLISQKTQEILDQDVQEILQSCLKEITEILSNKKELLEYFAQELLKKEELEYDEIETIFSKFDIRPLARTSL